MKRRLFLLKTEVHFTKNGGTFYQKRRKIISKMYLIENKEVILLYKLNR